MVQFLGWENSLEKGMAAHSSILAWRILMDRGAWQAAYSPWRHKELDTTEQLSTLSLKYYRTEYLLALKYFQTESSSTLYSTTSKCWVYFNKMDDSVSGHPVT